MAEEKQHRQLFGRHHKEEEKERISDEVAYGGGGGYSHTIEESVEDNEKVKRESKDKEHLGEIDALTDDDFDLYEKEEARTEPEHGQKSNIEEEQVSAIVGAGCAGCTCHERHEKKEGKEKEEEEEEEEEAESKKKLQT
ncbi:abscisic stress-ripening protein 3-like [Phalaenopsis equestris]|uniref:abscisic stress-ripening protein 3-like n=1 Tax=Phalaenopsis equestris TaxID=78828 RepID=UPI0009E55971|nr:abscisic stress-ripening protein 3-like [Phalaenopsis equestris]